MQNKSAATRVENSKLQLLLFTSPTKRKAEARQDNTYTRYEAHASDYH